MGEKEQPTVILTSVMIYDSCSWCHESVARGIDICPVCGHNPHKARLECDCPRCQTEALKHGQASPL